jgi:c-di-GMP-binding flagellar brake protein YcgR
LTPDERPGRGALPRRSREELDILLERLSGHIDSERLRGGDDRRAHERASARLILEYRRPGDERSYGGSVIDISRGGMRCVASGEVSEGEVLAVSVKSPRPGVLEGRLDAYGQVVRARRRGRVTELGLRFVHPQPAEGASPPERREHRRLEASFELAIRTADGRRAQGRVRNISAGGVDFVTDVELSLGEELAVSLGARRSPAVEGVLSSLARVTRSRRLGDHYEVAASFLG